MAGTLKKSKTTVQKPVADSAPRHPRGERDRLNFRIDARIKQRAENAAMLLGQDLSTFAETALDEKAQTVIEREQRILLSERDFARFVEALDNPEPPNDRLKAAAAEYKTTRHQHPELNW